jgi:hypothetical protein
MEDPESPRPPDSKRIDRNKNNRQPSDDDNDHRLMVTTAATTITLIRIRIRKQLTEAQTTISSREVAYPEQGGGGLVLNRMGGMTMR